jgi:hypothetical protein
MTLAYYWLLVSLSSTTAVKLEAGNNVTAVEVYEGGELYQNVYMLEAKGDFAEVPRMEIDVIRYFCHHGTEASLPRFWSSVSFNLVSEDSDYSVGGLLIPVDISASHQIIFYDTSGLTGTQKNRIRIRPKYSKIYSTGAGRTPVPVSYIQKAAVSNNNK